MADKMRTAPIAIVDAFANVPFEENPAAVCFIGDKFLFDEILQSIASEMNQAETAFVASENNNHKEGSCFELRWFTPTNEVPLSGHATSASAAVLFEIAENVSTSIITFSVLSENCLPQKPVNSLT